MPKTKCERPVVPAQKTEPQHQVRLPKAAALFITVVIILGLWVISGCTHLEPPPAFRLANANPEAWTLRGRVSIRTVESSVIAQKGVTASLTWEQRGSHYRIQLWGPLGMGMATISGQPGHAQVNVDRQSFEGSSPEKLLQTHLGWYLPVSGFPYWVRGKLMPETPSEAQRDPTTRLRTLKQQGWTIHFLEYRRYSGPAGDFEAPSRMTLEAPGIAIRMTVTAWNLSR